MLPQVLIVTGAMAAGKSTLGQALAERLERSVHLRGDVFRRMIVGGRAVPGAGDEGRAQLKLRYAMAAQAADGMESWLRGIRTRRLGPEFQRDLIADLAARGAEGPLDWDASAQGYLAIASMHQALGQDAPGLRDPRLRGSLAAMARKLNFPRNTDSPGAGALGNPIRDEFQKIRDLFSK